MWRQVLENKFSARLIILSVSLGAVSVASGQDKGLKSAAQQNILAIEKAIESEDFFLAENLLKQVPTEQQKELKFLVIRALVAKGFYRLDEASELLKEALRKNSDYGDALFEMALIMMEKKNWKDADVLLRLAGDAKDLSKQRQAALPYYLGVVSFESGRVYDSRNSFVRLNWRSALDPALEQSSAAYLARIARERPWSVVVPVSYQYESNVLGLAHSAALPEGYSQRDGGKIITGIFSSWGGIGGGKPGAGPWGVGLRFLSTRSIQSQFSSLNVIFVESETNWTRLINERWGPLRLAGVANWVQLGGQATTASMQVKSALRGAEVSLGYEADLKKDTLSDRSSVLFRGSQEFSLWQSGALALEAPVELGSRIPMVKDRPGEYRSDLAVTPVLSWAPNRRLSLKVSQKLSGERVSDAQSTGDSILQWVPATTITFTAQPYLILSGGLSFSIEKRTNTPSLVQKLDATFGVVGAF